MAIAGPVIVKMDNSAPVYMEGVWNVGVSIPTYRAYGQGQVGANGSVKPGSGYLGTNKGTAVNVTGSFRFTVDATGDSVKQTLLKGLYQTFTIDFPVGDQASANVKAKAIDCTFDSINFEHDGPNGKYIATGSMTAGKVEGLEPDNL